MAARESYASDRRQSGGYSSARSKAGQAYNRNMNQKRTDHP